MDCVSVIGSDQPENEQCYASVHNTSEIDDEEVSVWKLILQFGSYKPTPELHPLTSEQMLMYQDASNIDLRGPISVMGGRSFRNRESFHRMRTKTDDIRASDLWLDDEMVNAFGSLIQKRHESNPCLPKVIFNSSYFWGFLEKPDGYAKVKRWNRQVGNTSINSRLIYLL